MEDREISLELNKATCGTSFCSLTSIDKYMEYAKKHDLVFRYFPLLDCGYIIFNDKTTILSTEEEGTTTFSIKTMLI